MVFSKKDLEEIERDIPPLGPWEKGKLILEYFKERGIKRGKILLYDEDSYSFYSKNREPLKEGEVRLNIRKEDIPSLKTFFIQNGCSLFIEDGIVVVLGEDRK